MLAYVKAENAYADAMLAHIKPLETKVYNEIIGRLQQDDSTVPYLMNGYWYFRRFETGKEYPIYSRRVDAPNAPEEILLNGNELAKGHDFFEIGDIAISPNSKLMAWAEDTVGRRQYVVKVMELATRKIFPIELPNVENNVIWAGDNQTFFYIEKDPETLLGFRVRSHRLDSANHKDVAADPVVWTQEDESFYTQLYRDQGREIPAHPHAEHGVDGSAVRGRSVEEARIQGVPAARARPRIPGGARQRPLDRAHQLAGEELPHRRSAEAGAEADRTKWKDVVAHRDDAFVDAFDVSRNFLTIEEHSGGLRKLRIRPWRWQRRTSSSKPTSPATPWRSTSIASSTATSCATPTSPWSRRRPRTNTTSRRPSAKC